MGTPKIANRMPRLGRGNPGRKHLRGGDVTAKMQRQYEHVLESLRRYHRYPSDRKRKQVAAATVRKLAGQNPKVRIPREILTRLDDVGYDYERKEFWSELTPEQQSYVKDEAEHLIDLIQSGESWYGHDAQGRREARRDLKQAQQFLSSISRTRNIGNEESRAERIAEEFHGRPARETIEVIEDEAYDDYGAVLGYLQKLDILMEDGDTFIPIEFDYQPDSEDNVLVVSDPKGANIEFVGGDQDIDWQLVEGATEADKNLVLVGPVIEIDYYADKHHLEGPKEQEDGITYYHEFGEDDEELPYLVFDRRNRKLLFVGGNYTIEPEGITG
jgi:hypothetical protein